MRIERTRIDGEPVRRFHLLAEVTFADREAENPEWRNYYKDGELRSLVTGWMYYALEDRDDSPTVRFTDGTEVAVLRESVQRLKEAVTALTRIEQTPGSMNGNDAWALLRIVWQWIINANNGNGADSGDLINALESAGYQCPAELEDES